MELEQTVWSPSEAASFGTVLVLSSWEVNCDADKSEWKEVLRKQLLRFSSNQWASWLSGPFNHPRWVPRWNITGMTDETVWWTTIDKHGYQREIEGFREGLDVDKLWLGVSRAVGITLFFFYFPRLLPEARNSLLFRFVRRICACA